ncbi:MAG: DUF4418 family protein [Coriobacteriales bacterium]|jgi:hypothetical protein|nr:DUF4418 family protein [Coriobacteriales bacterium]
MKNRIGTGVGAIILGALVSLGPQFIFPLCEATEDGHFMQCHWTGQAEIGVGILIALLGLVLILCPSAESRLGLSIAVSLASLVVLLYPHVLIGGCAMEMMPCHTLTFPALTVLGILGFVAFALNSVYLYRGQRAKSGAQS